MIASMYVAASMGGFIARSDGDISWLGDTDVELQDYGYQAFYDAVDCLVMGGKTYRQIRSSHEWFYAGKPTWVYSRQPLIPDIPDVFHADVSPVDLVERLKTEGKKHLWILGGGEIHSLFLHEGLVDEIRLFLMPLALGEGVPLFAPPLPDQAWRLENLKRWHADIAELHYIRVRNGEQT